MRSTILLAILLFEATLAHAWHINVLWQRDGLQDSSGYGMQVLPLGDQNDDGYADWAVFASPPYNPRDSAYLEFFHGGNPPSTQPYMRYRESTLDSGNFGGAYAIGDVNGDGYQDWYVMAGYWVPWGWFEAQIFWGGPDADLVPDALWHFHWQTDEEQLHLIGDFNGDGFDDLYKWRRNGDVGFACFGGTAFDTLPDWSRTSPPEIPYQSYPEGHGDVNGDGYGEIIGSGGGEESYLYVFWGGQNPDTIPEQSFPVYQYGRTRVINDLNGDERDEVLAWGFDELTLHMGRDTLQTIPDVVMSFPCPYPSGFTVPVGDVNGDGYNDLILFARDCFMADRDYLALYLGNYQVSSQPAWSLQNRSQSLYLVSFASVAGLGDVNGDGIGDFAIGATNVDNDGTRGRVVILSGDTTVHVAADNPFLLPPSSMSLSVYPNPFNVSTTIQLFVPAYASAVELAMFNVLGQRVFDTTLPATNGRLRYVLDGAEFGSGVYFLRATAGGHNFTQKLMVLK